MMVMMMLLLLKKVKASIHWVCTITGDEVFTQSWMSAYDKH